MKKYRKSSSRIYLDNYILQKDMRIRMPKEVVQNLNVTPGKSYFEVYLEPEKKEIILSVKEN